MLRARHCGLGHLRVPTQAKLTTNEGNRVRPRLSEDGRGFLLASSTFLLTCRMRQVGYQVRWPFAPSPDTVPVPCVLALPWQSEGSSGRRLSPWRIAACWTAPTT